MSCSKYDGFMFIANMFLTLLLRHNGCGCGPVFGLITLTSVQCRMLLGEAVCCTQMFTALLRMIGNLLRQLACLQKLKASLAKPAPRNWLCAT